MVATIFGALDEADSGYLQLEHLQLLKSDIDEATFATVLSMVGGDVAKGVSLEGLAAIYLELELSDVRADYSALTGAKLAPKAAPPAPSQDPFSIPYDSLGWHPALPVSHDSQRLRHCGLCLSVRQAWCATSMACGARWRSLIRPFLASPREQRTFCAAMVT